MNESKYLIGCLLVAGGAIVGGFAGIVVGGAIGRHVDRQENAKRPLSPDNQKVAELGLTFLGGPTTPGRLSTEYPAALAAVSVGRYKEGDVTYWHRFASVSQA